ncbi:MULTISPECIES: OmpA family protein [unclassified Aureispira]|uniref:OmpA family protein n=1 Tax=unclassified Aureispira TaxID=2649989 RepID=UPI0006990097|nr:MULTISPECIES: OmpA family protein [unclassified Aureispira]WMX15657.1 OmpA family protein [Aureispira sp. CCB-E]
MKNLTSIYSLATVGLASLLLWSCGRAGGDDTGSEYMPDMSHSIAYEANYSSYYYNNTWDGEEAYRAYAGPRKPVKGTVARGYLPSKYQNLEDYRTSADETHVALQEKVRDMMMADASIQNEIKPTSKAELERVLTDGATLYSINCEVCHGEEADGNGVLYNEGEGKYSAKPANLVNEEFSTATDGRFLNAILHGKGMMQSHADKMSPMERWKVIHYIRSMQAAKAGKEYNPTGNVNVSPKPSLEESFNAMISELKANHDVQDLKINLDNVLYNSGNAELQSASSKTLNTLVALLEANPTVKIEISGHTDNSGDSTENLELSTARAQAVYQYLLDHNIVAERLSYKGYGDTQPVASNDTEEGKKQNRRTELKIVQ